MCWPLKIRPSFFFLFSALIPPTSKFSHDLENGVREGGCCETVTRLLLKESTRHLLDKSFEVSWNMVKKLLDKYSSLDLCGDHSESEAIQRLNLHTAMTNRTLWYKTSYYSIDNAFLNLNYVGMVHMKKEQLFITSDYGGQLYSCDRSSGEWDVLWQAMSELCRIKGNLGLQLIIWS